MACLSQHMHSLMFVWVVEMVSIQMTAQGVWFGVDDDGDVAVSSSGGGFGGRQAISSRMDLRLASFPGSPPVR